MFFFWDPTMLLLIPALIFAVWAQMKVQGTFSKFSEVYARSGITAYEAAKILLQRYGLSDIEIEFIPGALTDHYDPSSKVLRLSEAVYRSPSLAAIGVAAHEVGHAVQDATGYKALALRNAIVPVASIGSGLAFPLFIFGLLLRTPLLMDIGILLFVGVVIFHLITLPVEFDASARATRMLVDSGVIAVDEVPAVKEVLSAAAMTYVAATAMAAVNLIRLLLLRGAASDE